MSNGKSLSNENAALQGYVEGSVAGAYAGVWMSTLRDGTDDTETDLYLGYRNELPSGLSYDVSYTRYLYNNSGNCCGELALAMGYAVSDIANVGGKVAIDPSSKTKSIKLNGDVALNDQLSLSGTVGKVQNAQSFMDMGVTYALTDKASVDVRYHDANNDKGRVVLGLAFDTTLFSR